MHFNHQCAKQPLKLHITPAILHVAKLHVRNVRKNDVFAFYLNRPQQERVSSFYHFGNQKLNMRCKLAQNVFQKGGSNFQINFWAKKYINRTVSTREKGWYQNHFAIMFRIIMVSNKLFYSPIRMARSAYAPLPKQLYCVIKTFT